MSTRRRHRHDPVPDNRESAPLPKSTFKARRVVLTAVLTTIGTILIIIAIMLASSFHGKNGHAGTALDAFRRGKSLMEKKDFDSAISAMSEAIRAEPATAAFYCGRADAYAAKREFDNAIADYTEAIRLNPKNAGAYSGRGYAYGAKGDFDKAIADFTEAIRLNPKYTLAYAGGATTK